MKTRPLLASSRNPTEAETEAEIKRERVFGSNILNILEQNQEQGRDYAMLAVKLC